VSRTSFERDGLQLPAHVNGTRNVPSPAMSFAPRGSSLVPSPAPGSFSSDLRSQLGPSRAASRLDISAMNLERLDEDDGHVAEQAETALREMLSREIKIKEGSENMLEALNTKKAKQTKDQRVRVEAELNSSNQRIKDLKSKLSNLQRPKPPTTPTKSRVGAVFQSSDVRSPASVPRSAEVTEDEEATESPTYVLAEILQALEIEGLAPDYYVNHANNLVDLFKRHPTLKYDLVWSVFGLRMQVLLLSESREVVAAGYRMIRHAISDLTSLQKIRSLNTDYLVILSLIKERKADVEREQALKFVRAFLEVKDGVHEVSRGVVQTIAAVAEHGEDRLKAISIETLAEILVRNPALLIASGAMRSLIDALGEGAYEASEGLTAAFLYILDTPQRRKYLRSGYELEILFTVFTDFSYTSERILKQSSKAIATALKSWSGLLTLSMYNFRALRSLISSLALPYTVTREVVIDLIFTLLRIKAPSWSSSFLAGRRLTTYGRVTNLKAPTVKATPTSNVDEDTAEQNLIDHYTALLLAMLIRADTLPALLQVTKDAENQSLKRKTVLLIGEILKLADKLLPTSWSYDLQLLPELFATAANFGEDERFQATSTVYQLDSVTKTLYKSSAADSPVESKKASENSSDGLNQFDEAPKSISNLTYDEATFRQMLVDSHVLASTNYLKWNWDVILRVIEGPLTHGKRLDEAVKASKFIKRIMSFYRPFKYKFAEVRMTRPSQKYIRVGCALMHTLLQTQEGVRFLSDNKLLRQIAECLAQIDPTSGLTAPSAMFSTVRIQETLCSGYFAMLGTLSRDIKGLRMLDRWRIFSMMYHIIDHKQRPDLIKLFLSNFDYSLHGHPRVILSKALTAACKDVRILATNVLRRAISRSSINSSNEAPGDFKWAIQLLVTQLYDPDVEVSAAAIRILEEACNRRQYLEYIVECRPALDHLGEIGAPLLLRFLSTSIGYHYLDGLDYISNEMDDWFLGRNDAYVGVIEAVLARAFSESNDESSRRTSFGEAQWEVDPVENDTHVPPHFYRELARTQEGCKLLHDKGHFDEFAATIREYGMQSDDPDVILKVKGCLWAVGNVGCMELGAPFLESTDVVEEIVKIAENHEVMSLRGTAFFVLGLISRSVHGLEMLLEHGWESNTTLMGESLGLCIPRKLETLFSLKPWQHEKAPDLTIDEKQRVALAASSKDEDPMNQRILALVSDLGNTVLTKRAISELGHIKQKKAPGFKQVTLFRKVITIIESHHFRLPVRRFVIDLFDKSVLRQIVLDEESSEEDFASDTGSDSATERQRSVSAPSAPPGI
jgi:rapamycin-insensitive companion of mTOR